MELSTFGQTVTANISARLAEKMHTQIGYRADLHISDFQPLNKTTAKVLIGYNSSLGKPDVSQIETFIIKHFEGEVMADTLTAHNHPGFCVISCIVGLPRQSIKFEKMPETFTALAGDISFLDTKLGQVWNVEGDGEEKMLTRKFKNDIGIILDARQRAMMTHAGTISFSDLPNEGEIAVGVGYEVTVYHNNEQKTAVVASVQPNCVRLRLKDNSVIATTPKAILDVVKADAASGATTNQVLRDFYLQFYPAEMVDQMYPEGGGSPKFASNQPKK